MYKSSKKFNSLGHNWTDHENEHGSSIKCSNFSAEDANFDNLCFNNKKKHQQTLTLFD